jgi:hypothetical protein
VGPTGPAGTYAAGTGIAISSNTISLSTSGCVAGEVWRFNGSTFSCAAEYFSACTWARITGTAASTTLSVDCPAGKYAISGGCDAAGTASLLFTRPFGPPANGSAVTGTTSWYCNYSASAIGHSAYALCCNVAP